MAARNAQLRSDFCGPRFSAGPCRFANSAARETETCDAKCHNAPSENYREVIEKFMEDLRDELVEKKRRNMNQIFWTPRHFLWLQRDCVRGFGF